MPWTKESFKKHNKKKPERASHIANRLLQEGHSDASAIKLANWIVKNRKGK